MFRSSRRAAFDRNETCEVPAGASHVFLRAHARIEHRPQLGLTLEARPILSVQLHELGGDLDCFSLRLRLQDCPAADDLLALGERAVGHGDLAVGDPREARRARGRPSTGTFTALNLEQGSPGQVARERSTPVDEANAGDTEMRQIVPIQRTNEAYERVLRSDVR